VIGDDIRQVAGNGPAQYHARRCRLFLHHLDRLVDDFAE
jgi:hypothetical protein